jgi:hypothetical protein
MFVPEAFFVVSHTKQGRFVEQMGKIFPGGDIFSC